MRSIVFKADFNGAEFRAEHVFKTPTLIAELKRYASDYDAWLIDKESALDLGKAFKFCLPAAIL
jgi:hypothetical protein